MMQSETTKDQTEENGIVRYSNCPVCKSKTFSEVLSAKDHTVSGEEFHICECKRCGHRFTNPVPNAEKIGPYYKSEEYISHTNTSKGLINNLYQRVRKYTLKKKCKLISKVSGRYSGRLLDIGSGAGAFLSAMKNAGWVVLGLEPDESAREVAKKDFEVETYPIEQFYDLEEDGYDVITMWHVLEHVHDLDAYMEKMYKLLKDEGKLVIAVPNYNSKDAEKYGAFWAAYDVPRHLYHFRLSSMKFLLERNKFKLVKIKWMPFDSFYVAMLSEKYRGGSMIRGIWNGFCSYLVAMFKTERCSSIIYIVEKQ